MKETDKVVHLNERQNRIMEIMRQQNAVSVATLSSLMKVSEVTIRKDLTMLEEQHMLYRVHGSAILVNRYIDKLAVDLLWSRGDAAVVKRRCHLCRHHYSGNHRSGKSQKFFHSVILL